MFRYRRSKLWEVSDGLRMWQLLWSLLLEHNDQADDAAANDAATEVALRSRRPSGRWAKRG